MFFHAFFFFGIFFLFYSKYKKVIDDFFKKRYFPILSFIILFLALVAFFISLNRGFSIDEFEHIHSAWYIENKYLPYADFFQHHNPLLWYVLLPFLLVFGHSIKILLILRVFMFFLTMGIGLCVFLITKRLTRLNEAGFLSVLLLLSSVMFVNFSVTIRPDIPQVLFGLLSIYFFLSFLQDIQNRYMLFAGFSASVSFLFLQKTVFLLLAFVLIFLFMLFRRKISIKHIFAFTVSLLLPLVVFLVLLNKFGLMEDYFLTNWPLNVNFAQGDTFSMFRTLNYYVLKDFFFWPVSITAFWYIFRNKNIKTELKAAAFIALALFLSLFLLKRPWGHNFLFPLAALSIVSGYFFQYILERFKLKETFRVLIVLLIIFIPGYFLLQICSNNNRLEIERADYVLQNSLDSDLVYDGKNQFNLFRHDLHYFWFSLKKSHGLDTYNSLTDGKYEDYDICRLIKTKKPKFISDFQLDLKQCGLEKMYKKTEQENLYIRIQDE